MSKLLTKREKEVIKTLRAAGKISRSKAFRRMCLRVIDPPDIKWFDLKHKGGHVKKTIAIALFLFVCATQMVCAETEAKTESVELRIYDRIMIAGKLPTRESFDRALAIKDLKNKIELTQEELKKYGVVATATGGVRWNKEGKDYIVSYTFTDLEIAVLKDTFNKLDSKKQVPVDEAFLELYTKIKNMK